MIEHEEFPHKRSTMSEKDDAQVSAHTYHQKIVARQCLNKLVDIKTALSRQNRLLELLIDRINASQIRNSST